MEIESGISVTRPSEARLGEWVRGSEGDGVSGRKSRQGRIEWKRQQAGEAGTDMIVQGIEVGELGK